MLERPPPCTHPLLADLARLVNDHTSDEERHKLAVLIPSVVGLTSDDPHVDARLAHRCAVVALPVAAADRQNILAAAVLDGRLRARRPGRPADRSP